MTNYKFQKHKLYLLNFDWLKIIQNNLTQKTMHLLSKFYVFS